MIAIFNAMDACSHRWRWIRERLKTQSREKHIDLVFNDDDVAINTPNSNGTMRYTAFTDVTIAPGGMFLVPDTGVSIFVPRTAFDSDDDFQRVGCQCYRKVCIAVVPTAVYTGVVQTGLAVGAFSPLQDDEQNDAREPESVARSLRSSTSTPGPVILDVRTHSMAPVSVLNASTDGVR